MPSPRRDPPSFPTRRSSDLDAGAFAVVLEKLPEPLASEITGAIEVPTIGIGASARCDGQVLVVDDMLGLFTDFRPKFVRRYADRSEEHTSELQSRENLVCRL